MRMGYRTHIGVEQTTERGRTRTRDGARVLPPPAIASPQASRTLCHSRCLSFPALALVQESPPANCRERLLFKVTSEARKVEETLAGKVGAKELLGCDALARALAAKFGEEIFLLQCRSLAQQFQ